MSTGKFRVIKASAGSGKTYTLVHIFLSCCLQSKNPNYFRHILAITFTNKAASEMKERVLKAVKKLANQEDAELLESIAVANQKEPEEVSEHFKKVHKAMLHGYGDLSIMTIDKFVNRLVRSFTKDLGLHTDFKLELDDRKIISASVEEMIDRVGEDQELTQVLAEYAMEKVEDEDQWNFQSDLIDFGSNMTKEAVLPVLKELRKFKTSDLMEVRKKIRQELHSAVSQWKKWASECVELIEKAGIESGFSRGTIPKYLKQISEGNFKKVRETAGLRKPLEDGELSLAKSASPEIQSSLEAVHSELFHKYSSLFEALLGPAFDRYTMLNSLRTKLFQMAVLGQMDEQVQQYQEREKLMTFHDLNKLISELVDD
ncbi:MAG: UvrD-helicase domain-containing protein, partial [Flavobacteriales bacterium]|nr:UvrD-helicase domain-containing protein [Flavobacteriales bacterium]